MLILKSLLCRTKYESLQLGAVKSYSDSSDQSPLITDTSTAVALSVAVICL